MFGFSLPCYCYIIRDFVSEICQFFRVISVAPSYNSFGASKKTLKYMGFLHNRPWISPRIKSISNELDITIYVIAPQLSGHCDVISNRLWRHQQTKNRASETRGRCEKIVVLSSFMDLLRHARNKIMYVLSWRTVSALTRVLLWYLFPSLLRNSGNKHQNNPLVSAETVRYSSSYIILYKIILCALPQQHTTKHDTCAYSPRYAVHWLSFVGPCLLINMN